MSRLIDSKYLNILALRNESKFSFSTTNCFSIQYTINCHKVGVAFLYDNLFQIWHMVVSVCKIG